MQIIQNYNIYMYIRNIYIYRPYMLYMAQLELKQELLSDIIMWMKPKYAISTVKNRTIFLKKMFKENDILDYDALRKIMNRIKYQYERACIIMINKYCYDNKIDFNLIVPGIKKQPVKFPELLSQSEIKLMIMASPKPYDLCIRCIFNMGAGLRISEIIKFSWNHIRWVDWLSNKNNYGVAVIKSGKGSKDRVVNIPKKLMEDLYMYAKESGVLNEFRIPTGGMIFNFGITNINKKLMIYDIEEWKYNYVSSRYNWFRYNILHKYCEKALNKRIKIHSLRHSKATYLYEVEKVPIEKIQILLGHSSINTTMLYTKINPISIFEIIKNTNEI